jgi:hypothetical protein
MTLEDHRRGFTAAMAALIAEFNAYLDRGGADPTADRVSYKQMTLWLSPAERSRLIGEITRLLLLFPGKQARRESGSVPPQHRLLPDRHGAEGPKSMMPPGVIERCPGCDRVILRV